MSLARTDLGKIINATGTGPFTSSSFTPINSSLLVIKIYAQDDSGAAFAAADLALNSNTAGLTFTLRTEVVNTSAYGGGIRTYTAPVTTGVSMTINVGTATRPYAMLNAYAYCYTGYDTASPIGLTLQSTAGPSSGAWSPSLGGTTAATSEVLAGVIGIINSGTGSYTPGTGWTELFDELKTDYVIWQGQYEANSAISTVDWADLSAAGGYYINPMAVAIEVKAASISAVASLVKLPPGRAPGKQPPPNIFQQGALAPTSTVSFLGTGLGTGLAAALLTGSLALSGAAFGTSLCSGNLTGSGALNGDAVGTSVAAANGVSLLLLNGSAIGTAAAQGLLTGAGTLTGCAIGTSDGNSLLTGSGELIGSSIGAAYAQGLATNATNFTAINGAAIGGGLANALLTGNGALSGSAFGAGLSSANLTASGLLNGCALGASTVTGLLYDSASITAITGAAIGYAFAVGNLADSPQQASGGWEFYESFDRERRRHKQRLAELDEQEEAEQRIKDEKDAEISKLLHEQERKDFERDQLARLKNLAMKYSAQDADTERVKTALIAAQQMQTFATLQRLAREIERQLQEEEFVLLLLLSD